MSLDVFLSRLKKVRSTGKNSWVACCSGHDDKNPSLSVSQGSDGRVLVHCFSHGCSVSDIAAGVGMQVHEFMPDNPLYHRAKPLRMPFNPLDVLYACRDDLTVALVLCNDLKKKTALTPQDSLLLAKITGRLGMAIQLAGGE